MFPNLPTPASKEADRQMLAALLDQHLESGGAVRVVPGYRQAPLPARSMQIDPETVLKRHRPKPKAKPAEPQQPTFAQLVDQVTAEPAPEFAAIVAGLRTLAANGASLMGAASQLGISEAKARWHAKRNGILFEKRCAPRYDDTALLALARVLASSGETINIAAKKLSCGCDRLRRLADQHGIEFRSGRRRA